MFLNNHKPTQPGYTYHVSRTYRLVYDVNKHFETKCWVHVSQTFNVEKILHTFDESINPSKSSRRFHLDAMQNCVENMSEEKRFLMVLDDVWIERSKRKK